MLIPFEPLADTTRSPRRSGEICTKPFRAGAKCGRGDATPPLTGRDAVVRAARTRSGTLYPTKRWIEHAILIFCLDTDEFDFDRRTRSLWMDTEVAPQAPSLNSDRTCDTVISGPHGLRNFRPPIELATNGQKVILVDRGEIGGGITARTTAHLAPLCDDLTSEMIKLRGESTFQRHSTKVRRTPSTDQEEIQKKENIACDFRRLDGYLFQALNTDSQIIDDDSMPYGRSVRRCIVSSA